MTEYIIDEDMIIAEAVREKIVRCRDCKHCVVGWCCWHNSVIKPDGFCAWGEWRSE